MGDGALEAVREVAVAALCTHLGGDPREAVGAALLHALDGDVVAYNRVRARSVEVPVVGPSWARSVAPPPEVLGTMINEHPLVRHYNATGSSEVLAVTDVVSPAAWGRSPVRALLREVIGMDRQLAVPLRAPAGEQRAWTVMRATGVFDARSRALAADVQQVLSAVEVQREVLARAAHPEGAQPSPTSSPLTPREHAVLVLLADGLTAVAIAHRLSMSPRTATTHLQHIYRKLDVCDRLRAVLRAQEHGLLPPRRGP